MKNILLALCVSAASLTLAEQASATVHHITYSGTVTSADDQTGEFGPNPVLTGTAFKAYVAFDDAKQGATDEFDTWMDVYGGQDDSNPISAVVKINGVSRSIGSTPGYDIKGYDSRYDYSLMPGCANACTLAGFQQVVEEDFYLDHITTKNYFGTIGQSQDGSISGLSHTPPNFTSPPVDMTAVVYIFQWNDKKMLHYATVTAKIDSVSSAVPEPGTWALMVGGFGMTGGMLRRRQMARIGFA